MRRTIGFLLLAATAAPSLAQGWSPPPGQQRDQGDRGDQRDRGDRGSDPRGNPQVGNDRGPGGNQPGGGYRPGDGRDNGGRGNYAQAPQDYRGDRDGRGPGGGFQNRGPGRPDGDYRGPGGRGPDGPDGRGDGRNWRDDRGGPREGYNGYNGAWNNRWREDRRYNWQGYRAQNRAAYRLPRYAAPRGYTYRRWSPGYRIDPFLYSRNYWIADPYQYRLPPAYGPYRWVRYYDDVALVDTRSGIIADIIYSFFF